MAPLHVTRTTEHRLAWYLRRESAKPTSGGRGKSACVNQGLPLSRCLTPIIITHAQRIRVQGLGSWG